MGGLSQWQKKCVLLFSCFLFYQRLFKLFDFFHFWLSDLRIGNNHSKIERAKIERSRLKKVDMNLGAQVSCSDAPHPLCLEEGSPLELGYNYPRRFSIKKSSIYTN
jgi:hypothetical protein